MFSKIALLAAFLAASVAAQARVFELRIYHCNEGKLEALKARFRDHTTKLFAKHGIENIGYWVPQDAEKGKNDTLYYIVAHPSKEAAAANWKKFREDPAWVAAREASEKNGKIVQKVESIYLDPTDFSKLK